MSELVKECHHGRLTRQCRECDMEKEICELQDQLTTITKQRDELIEVLESAGNEIYMLINEVNKLRMMQVNSTTETPPDLHDMETCHVIGKLLSTIKEQKDAE